MGQNFMFGVWQAERRQDSQMVKQRLSPTATPLGDP